MTLDAGADAPAPTSCAPAAAPAAPAAASGGGRRVQRTKPFWETKAERPSGRSSLVEPPPPLTPERTSERAAAPAAAPAAAAPAAPAAVGAADDDVPPMRADPALLLAPAAAPVSPSRAVPGNVPGEGGAWRASPERAPRPSPERAPSGEGAAWTRPVADEGADEEGRAARGGALARDRGAARAWN